jgi:hypothetical protein
LLRAKGIGNRQCLPGAAIMPAFLPKKEKQVFLTLAQKRL